MELLATRLATGLARLSLELLRSRRGEEAKRDSAVLLSAPVVDVVGLNNAPQVPGLGKPIVRHSAVRQHIVKPPVHQAVGGHTQANPLPQRPAMGSPIDRDDWRHGKNNPKQIVQLELGMVGFVVRLMEDPEGPVHVAMHQVGEPLHPEKRQQEQTESD